MAVILVKIVGLVFGLTHVVVCEQDTLDQYAILVWIQLASYTVAPIKLMRQCLVRHAQGNFSEL